MESSTRSGLLQETDGHFEGSCALSLVREHQKRKQPKQWARGRLLGKGAFGSVNMAADRYSGEIFAVKSAGGDECHSPRKNAAHVTALENEISILTDLDCAQVVKYLGSDWSMENGKLVRNLLLEYVPGGSLGDLIHVMGGSLEESLIRRYARDITAGLADIHRRRIVHGDIKGQNILVDVAGVKIADFGTAWRLDRHRDQSPTSSELASQASKEASQGGAGRSPRVALRALGEAGSPHGVRGTIAWMSPETVREDGEQGTAVDIWSLGCTVIEMATGAAPWQEIKGGPFAVMYTLGCTAETPRIPSGLSPLAQDFIARCLLRDPAQRWSAEQLLQHPFLSASVPACAAPPPWLSPQADADAPRTPSGPLDRPFLRRFSSDDLSGSCSPASAAAEGSWQMAGLLETRPKTLSRLDTSSNHVSTSADNKDSHPAPCTPSACSQQEMSASCGCTSRVQTTETGTRRSSGMVSTGCSRQSEADGRQPTELRPWKRTRVDLKLSPVSCTEYPWDDLPSPALSTQTIRVTPRALSKSTAIVHQDAACARPGAGRESCDRAQERLEAISGSSAVPGVSRQRPPAETATKSQGVSSASVFSTECSVLGGFQMPTQSQWLTVHSLKRSRQD